jgi:hypothetical protein
VLKLLQHGPRIRLAQDQLLLGGEAAGGLDHLGVQLVSVGNVIAFCCAAVSRTTSFS